MKHPYSLPETSSRVFPFVVQRKILRVSERAAIRTQLCLSPKPAPIPSRFPGCEGSRQPSTRDSDLGGDGQVWGDPRFRCFEDREASKAGFVAEPAFQLQPEERCLLKASTFCPPHMAPHSHVDSL